VRQLKIKKEKFKIDHGPAATGASTAVREYAPLKKVWRQIYFAFLAGANHAWGHSNPNQSGTIQS
jgi:hypothetical protein